MYICYHCHYETIKKANFLRHMNRKFKCKKIPSDAGNVPSDAGNVPSDAGNVSSGAGNVSSGAGNVSSGAGNVPSGAGKVSIDLQKNEISPENLFEKLKDKYQCNKCKKLFTRKGNLKNHFERCDGLSKLQCEICHKLFNNRKAKYHHKRTVYCSPPPPPLPTSSSSSDLNNDSIKPSSCETTTPSTQISNNNTNISNNTCNDINSHNITNNITNNNNIIAFGEEGIEQLKEFFADKPEIIESLKQISKKKFYGVREIQNKMFFNLENPKGMSIIKPDKYGSAVRVKNSEGEFEYREFRDVRETIFNYIEGFMGSYNELRKKFNVKLTEQREKNLLRDFCKIIYDKMDIYMDPDLMDDLGLSTDNETNKSSRSYEYSSDQEDEDDKKYKKFDRLSLDNIHEQTKKHYVKKKGVYVVKDSEENS